MAALQQNSTLIDDNLDGCQSLLNLPEELNRYSPILPPKNKRNQPIPHQSKSSCTNNNNNNFERILHYDKNNGQKDDQQQEHQRQHKYKHYRSGSSRGGNSRRSRSISLYGVNSTVEQGHKEIPIWIGDETRYVSGVTNKTTCNDIIKALIDDEIHNGNNAYCCKKDGGTASRDYSDYVITESWRGIERSYDGNMAILPVWKAWSRVHNELRLALKHQKDIRDPIKYIKTKNSFASLRKYICKLLRLIRSGKKDTKSPTEKAKEKCLLSNKDEIPDEFLFVILPDKLYDKTEEVDVNKGHKSRNKNLKPTSEESSKQAEAKLLKEKLYRLSETRASIRKRRRRSTIKRKDKKAVEKRRNSLSLDANNCIRRRKDASIRSSIRNKLAQKTSEVDELYDREYALTKVLTNKCKLYKLQNELYTNPEKQLEISIGQIQRNVEEYAKEIIKTEHELLDLKNEIKQDISIINNLKRMTIESGNDCGVPLVPQKKTLDQQAKEVGSAAETEADERMQFVDNIYEFCDNNASMLV